jgi:hypothetical protein
VYSYSVLLDNSTATICTGGIAIVYSSSILLTTGDTIYYDSGFAVPVTGYNYVARFPSPSDIYDLNPGTGVIGADTTLNC